MIFNELPNFHAGNRGSNPRGDANLQMVKSLRKSNRRLFLLLCILFLLAFPSGTSGADPWSKQDLTLEGIYLIFKTLDLGQTLDIAGQPDRYHEVNPIIGEHPSKNRVYAYFITTSLLHIGITHFLPKAYRPWFQGVTIGLSAGCVIHNYSIGLRVRF